MAEAEKFDHWEAIRQFSENVSPIDFYLIFENWRMFLDGALNTAILVSLGLLFAGLIAIPLAVCQVSRLPILSRVVGAYTYFFRGTPLLLQLYLIYYGFSEIDFIRNGMLWVIFKDAWLCTLIAFTINSAAYTTEILRGAFEQIPEGEVEAALYMIIVFLVTRGFNLWEKQWFAHLRPRET